jgi:hypothetical protein
MAGYSQAELDDVQAKWQLRFPPDLVDLLRERRPLIDDPQCFDWVTADPEHIRERLAWPFESYWASIERHELWWPEWGERPSKPSDQRDKVRAIFAAAPKLIPLLAHRYLPDEPHESGNPVFSAFYSDIIHYGANLRHWLACEPGMGDAWRTPWPPIRDIRFWGQAVRHSADETSVVRQQIALSSARLRRAQSGET